MEDSHTKNIAPRQPVLRVMVYIIAVLILLIWLAYTPAGILGKADAVGYAVCHRIEMRSFNIGGVRQMPLCARCTGMYLGAVTGLVFLWLSGNKRSGMPAWPVLTVFAFFFAAFGIDGLNSYLHLFPGAPGVYEPHNWLRLFTGTGIGLAMAAAIFLAFNQTMWADMDWRPVVPGLRSLGLLVLLAVGIDLLVLTESPFVLYPMALISAIGVMILLTMVHSMFIVMLLRMENKATRLRQIVFPLIGGMAVALLQIAAFDLVRYWFTGTWEGFHFG